MLDYITFSNECFLILVASVQITFN